MNTSSRLQAGLSLIELLVATSLAMFIALAASQAFIAAQRADQLVNAQLAMQDQARFALDQLARAIRAAGFIAGSRRDALHWQPPWLDDPNAPPCTPAWFANLRRPVHGHDGGPNTPLPGCTLGGYLAGSDVLVLRGADANGRAGTGYLPAAEAAALGDDTLLFRGLPDGPGVLFQAHRHAEAAALLGHAGDAEGALTWRYRAEVFHAATPSGSGNTGAVLYLRALRHGSIAQPLIDGVEQLRFFYGVDTDGDGQVDQWLRAGQLDAASGPGGDAWARVRALRIALLLHADVVTPRADTRALRLPDGSLHEPPPALRDRPRQLYVHDVALRNHRPATP